jgi:hypothetical protein
VKIEKRGSLSNFAFHDSIFPARMNAPVKITEIIGRCEQGMTRPFICAAGRAIYYVKGAYAGKNSLCCEWVANRLANLVLPNLSLRLPKFCIAEVPEGLIEDSARPDIRDLGAGRVFASLQIEDGQELTWWTAQRWPEEIMASLLLLDLWIQNEDRSLSAFGGNPNLLVGRQPSLPGAGSERAGGVNGPRQETLWAFDFNLAFDDDFNRERFFESHVFGRMLKRWPTGFQERMEPHLQYALSEMGTIFAELPLEWLHLDGDDSLPVQLVMERVISVLKQPFTDPDRFWKLP